uniref:Plant intracellular Ras-group-related LRR protein 4 n=1 Tax=Momordica charantia TaxID=3673 RepID=A0A0H4TD57_MOMCH|nr:plant intracellular Ras-group-related LRR protein 4 [Momordica charantia]
MEVSSSAKTTTQVVQEITNLHKSLPARPEVEEVEAAKVLISNVDKEEQARLEAIERQTKNPDVPEELFRILLDMQRNLISFHSKEQKREALKLLDLEGVHNLFDELIQRASKCASSPSTAQQSPIALSLSSSSFSSASLNRNSPSPSVSGSVSTSSAATSSFYHSDKGPTKTTSQLFTRDDSFVPKGKSAPYMDGFGARPGASSSPFIKDPTLKLPTPPGKDGEKLSLMALASLIEVSAKKGSRELNLRNKLSNQLEWLPDTIGKLSSLITLDLSENRLAALPDTIGALSQLKRLDLHANRLSELPGPFTDLTSLVCLDLRGNQLVSLPASLGKLVHLEEIDLSSNMLTSLPESIGNLVKLRKLNVETNNIEEIPHTIGRCTSLQELSADYNRLKALPEAVGRIETLQILSVRYNNVKQLPTTMSSLVNLRELDVSFNEIEAVPESLCFATRLVKMNIGNNFADLQALPRSIGNLEMLEELDISNNQIRFLPDSFRMLTNLRILRAEGNPFEVPPRQIFENGAQAVVQYMIDLYENRNANPQAQPVRRHRKSWTHMCFFSRSSRRDRDPLNDMRA